LIEEAGGVMMTTNGSTFDLYASSVLAAASSSLAAELVAAVNQNNI
jgi:fructose-1,6-bisphosphatase/inositol monophosphatase family enzyme